MRIIHRGLILTGVPLLLSITIVATMFGLIIQTDQQRDEEAKRRHISELATTVMLRIYDAFVSIETSLKTHDPAAKQRFKSDMIELRDSQAELLELGKDDPSSTKLWGVWDECVNGSIEQFRSLLGALKSGHFNFASIFGLQKLQDDFGTSTQRLIDTYDEIVEGPMKFLEAAPKREQQAYTLQCIVLASGVSFSAVLAFMLSRWFMSQITGRLRVISENSIRLTKEQALIPAVKGDDEIADLDRAFHTMAEHLQAALVKERAIFQSASDIICVFDRDGKFVSANPASERILGFPAAQLVGTKLTEYTFEEDAGHTAEFIHHVQTGDPNAIFESRVRNKNGDYLDLLWSIYWSRTQQLAYAVAHDISESKRAERMKEEFLGMVSHDLRSPLASIYGTFQLMTVGAFGKLPDLLNEKIDMGTRNASRLLRLINDLLDLSKLETGMFELARTQTEIGPMLERAVSEVEPLSQKRGVQIVVQNALDEFNIDPDRMMQVLVNLLSNAIKFSPDNGSVRVRCWKEGELMRLEVADQGRGVPPSYREAIFQRFKQVDISDSKSKGGSGLGLPICKQIVELHGGKVAVESPGPNQGSTFWFTIPSEYVAPVVVKAAVEEQSESVESGPARVTNNRLSRLAAAPDEPGSQKSKRFNFADLPLAKKAAVLVIVPVIFEVIFAGSMFVLLDGSFQAKKYQQHQRAIAMHAANLIVTFYGIGTVMGNAQSESSWQRFQKYTAKTMHEEQELLELTKDDKEDNELVRNMQTMLEPAHQFIDRANEIVAKYGHSPAVLYQAFQHRQRLQVTMTEAMPSLEQLVYKASKNEANAPIKASNRTDQGTLLVGGLIASALICGLSAWLFSIGITRRVKVIHENTRYLDSGQKLNPRLPGEDEIASLDHVFHSMALAVKEASAKERAVFDNSADVMCVVDMQGKILRMNPACERLWGYKPHDVIGRNILGIMVEPDREKAAWYLSHNLEDQNRVLENRIICRDRSVRIMHWSLSWSPEENCNIAIAHDVTKRKELEQLKKEFLSMVSHDMRTPLSAIQGITKLMKLGAFGVMPVKASDQLGKVERSCDRLLALVNDLLDMDKLESGHMQLAIQPTPALDILERTCQALESFAKQHQTSFNVQVPPGLMVQVDGDRLVQVGVNLLSNAVKYSPEGGVVTVTAFIKGSLVEFRIIDQGPGIPPEYLDAIFEKYKMAPSVDGKKRAGTGLGLPICKQIVEQHGGNIGVMSEVGRGSCFWFTVPLAGVPQPQQAMPRA